MAIGVVFRASARNDIRSLTLRIATDSGVDRAEGFVSRIEARCVALSEFPLAGRLRADFSHGVRTIAFERRILIAYVVSENAVEIVRVLYGGRDVEALLSESD